MAAGRTVDLDISSDLEELARTAVAVVCAGPKAILDLPLTLEYLETRGVPVAAIGQAELPGFYSRRSGVPAPISVADEAEAARLVGAHLGLGLGSGILVCVPGPGRGGPSARGRPGGGRASHDRGRGPPASTGRPSPRGSWPGSPS